MKVSHLKTALAVSSILSAAAFQPSVSRHAATRSSVSIAVQSSDNEEPTLGRRSFFSSSIQKAAAASLLVTSTPSYLGVAHAADSFPKVYMPAAHSMDEKLGVYGVKVGP